jgi:hypothetical protein
MKRSFIIFMSAGLLLTGSLSSCSKEIGSLNGASVDEISANPTRFELNNLVVGSEAGMRNQIATYLDAISVLGREMYRFSAADPRFTTELLGKEALGLDNSAFYIANPWNARYRVVKNCNIIISGATNSTFISPNQKKGYIGFAKTIKAYQLLINLNLTENNGVRVDVADASNIGPFLNYEQSLTEIAKLLDEGKTELTGAELVFTLSAGFDNNGGGVLKFNRAIAARVAAYRKNWAAVLDALDESFFDIDGNLNHGFYHTFSTGPNDQTNPTFSDTISTGELRMAHPSYMTDLNNYEPNDDRKNKVYARDAQTSDGLSSSYNMWVFTTNTSSMPIIRQEELILLYAEAKANLDEFGDAQDAIDRIRTAHGGVAYGGALTRTALIDEVLFQRRFSLLYEGHRWVDARRYNKLNTLPTDRAGDDVFERMPRPLTEGQ